MKVGDIVRVDHSKCRGQEYRITKVKPVNLDLEDISTGRQIIAAKSMCEFVRTPTYQELIDMVESSRGPGLVLGSVVRMTRAPHSSKWTYPADQKFVVIAIKTDRVNIAKLGGDGDRYWRMPREDLEVVNA